MGLALGGAHATILVADKYLTTEIPEEWSMEDAATVPCVYCTVMYAFFVRGNLKFGQSVLIHLGAGGVGQAAINVALSNGCVIFTTVGSKEKKKFIRKHFPQIPGN